MAWPGAEAVERGAHCQGHTGMGDTDRKGQTQSCGQGEPREVPGQGGDIALTRRAHMGCLSERVWVLCFSPRWGHPGGLMQMQISKPIPDPQGWCHLRAGLPNILPPFLTGSSMPFLSLCSLGRTDLTPLAPWFLGDGLMAPVQGGVCDQSLASEHQPWAFCGDIRDQTLFPPLSRKFNNCEAGRVITNNS